MGLLQTLIAHECLAGDEYQSVCVCVCTVLGMIFVISSFIAFQVTHERIIYLLSALEHHHKLEPEYHCVQQTQR